jgi:hypothetical protein
MPEKVLISKRICFEGYVVRKFNSSSEKYICTQKERDSKSFKPPLPDGKDERTNS